MTSIPLPETPLGVWDARADSRSSSPYWWYVHECQDWFDAHIGGADLRNRTFRVEFYMVDVAFCVVYAYWQDEQGRRMINRLTKDVRVLEPEIITLDELPPAHLLRVPWEGPPGRLELQL